MKLADLTHELTPPELQQLNTQIVAALLDNDTDESNLRALIEQRDIFLSSYVPSLEVDARQQFIKAELAANQQLVDSTRTKQKQILSELVRLVKGQKAVKKYK